MPLYNFYFRRLDKMQQGAYNTFKSALIAHKRKITFEFIPNIHQALSALKHDCAAELYYVNWSNVEQCVSFISSECKIIFAPKYLFTDTEVKALNLKIEKIVSKFSRIQDRSLQCRKVHDWLTLNVRYDNDETEKHIFRCNNHNIIGPLIERKSVCEGFAKAYQFILNRLGIDCMTVCGRVMKSEQEYYKDYHAWNIIVLNGKRYNVDVTWDKPLELNGKKRPTYGYYCVPGKMFGDHISGLSICCDGLEENMFYKAGRLFSSMKELKEFLIKPNKYDLSLIYVLGLQYDMVLNAVKKYGKYKYRIIRTSKWDKCGMLTLVK